MERKKVLMIVNPRAGKMTFKNSFYTVVKRLSDADLDVTVHFTTARGDATNEIVQKADETDLVIACGGDGTYNECVSGILKSGKNLPIGYIPCGSTNDFAATLDMIGTPAQLTERIICGKSILLDVGRFNNRYFTYVASFGAFTAISYDTPQNLKNALGHFAYMLNVAKQLVNMPTIPMHVIADKVDLEGEFVYGGVTNTTSIGGFYSLPEDDVVLDDGKFEVLLLRAVKPGQEYTETLLNLAMRNFDDPNVVYFHTDYVVFESTDSVAFTLDGEYGGSEKVNTIRCLNRAITLRGSEI